MNKGLKNIVASMLPQVVNIITNLILPGLIIARFGSEINGLVSTSKNIITYISLVGAGIATACTQALYKPVANDDTESVKRVLKASGNMFNRYGAYFCIITLIVSCVYPLFIRTDINYLVMTILLIVISLSGASEFFAIGRCRALLYAKQQVYVCSVIQAISLILGFLLAVSMLKANASIIIVQLSISIIYVVRGVFLKAYINKRYPEYKNYRECDPDLNAIGKKNDAMIHQLSGVVVTGSQAIILTLFVGLEAASIYAVYNIVFSGIQCICSNISTAVTPFLGRELALGNKSKLNSYYNAVEYAFFSLVAFVFSVTAMMLSSFIKLYTTHADINYVYAYFGIVFIFCSCFYIIKLPSTSLINAAGQFKETRWHAISEASISLILNIILTIMFGKEGVLLGTATALLWRCIITLLYSNKNILDISNKRSFVRLSKTLLMISLFCIASILIPLSPAGPLQWILYAIGVSFVAIVLLVIDAIVFEKETAKDIISLVRKR